VWDDLDVFAGVLGDLAVSPLHEAERAFDTRIDFDMRHRTRRRREQPPARDPGIEPGVEDTVGSRAEAAGDAYRTISLRL
jgi:hypothetical protein